MIYKYDSRGNLVQTTDSTGVTTFKYDGNDYLKEIDYPGGRVLKFTYDAAGRRTSMTDQAGHVTCYSYDAAGRLKQLTDGAKNNIILYEYDADGRVSKKPKAMSTRKPASLCLLCRRPGEERGQLVGRKDRLQFHLHLR